MYQEWLTRNIVCSTSLVLVISSGLANDNVLFPGTVFDTDGEIISIDKLSRNRTVCVITVKATWCPVCREQLIRIRDRLAEYKRCNLTFLVLVPGEPEAIKHLKERTRLPFPFIQDKELRISERYSLDRPPVEIFPAIFILNKDRTLRWMHRGRGHDYYSDQALSDYLDCSNWI